MNKKIIAIIAAASITSPIFAATATNAQVQKLAARTQYLEKQVQILEQEIHSIRGAKMPPPSKHSMHHKRRLFNYGSAVTVSPYVGVRAAYDASDLITNLPSMNEDLVILRQRQQLENHIYARGGKHPDRPLVEISGHVEGQVWSKSGYDTPNKSDVDLSGAEIDLLSEITHWATAYLSLSYNKYPPGTGSGARTTNSNVQVSRAFATIGDLNRVPAYVTIGQIYVPFGLYANFMTTDPLTLTLGRAKQRAILLGLAKYGFYGSVYGFRGDSHTTSRGTINNWGVNAGYGRQIKRVHIDVGAGYIGNIADSAGVQGTGSLMTNAFTGLGYNGNEVIRHRVPGFDVHAEAKTGPFTFLSEYIGTTRAFDSADFNFNGKGARLSAVDFEGAYKFRFHSKPIVLSVGYGRSWQALMLNMPKQSYMARAAISIFKDTIESIEYRHDVNYRNSDSYSFGGNTINGTSNRQRNLVTFQIGVYF
ncbi:MAG: LbtU family siderophore porin [Gammaproteobacteria bacterium]|nr:LbtU family siderophore porin [Gammaproteobacteria bacterium]